MTTTEYAELAEDPEQKALLEKQWKEAVDDNTITCPCGLKRHLTHAYRCFYCGVWFCFPCSEKHFGHTMNEWKHLKRMEKYMTAAEGHPMPICEVCDQRRATAVVTVPGVPYSAAYCSQCLVAGAHPMFILIANTACIGGLEQANEDWKQRVRTSLTYLGKTEEWFIGEVAKSIEIINKTEGLPDGPNEE